MQLLLLPQLSATYRFCFCLASKTRLLSRSASLPRRLPGSTKFASPSSRSVRDKKEVDDAEDDDDSSEEPLHRRRVERPFFPFLVPIAVDFVLAEVSVESSKLLPLLLECASSKSPAFDEVSAQGFFGNLENEEYGLTFSFCCASHSSSIKAVMRFCPSLRRFFRIGRRGLRIGSSGILMFSSSFENRRRKKTDTCWCDRFFVFFSSQNLKEWPFITINIHH